jgi:hypothetical protein
MTDAEMMCRGLAEPAHGRAVELAENLLCMEQVLRESRPIVLKSPLVIEYDNGGGQCGVRKNPVHEMYNATMRQYVTAVDKFVQLVGVAQAVDEEADTPLDRILRAAGRKQGRTSDGG